MKKMKYQQSKGVVFSWTKVGELLEKSQITEKADWRQLLSAIPSLYLMASNADSINKLSINSNVVFFSWNIVWQL